MAKKLKPSLDEQLKSEYDRWNYLYTHGGQDPFWADGCNMDIVRNHIINIKAEMEETGQLTDTYYRETPHEVDMDYMARAYEIRENAKKSLEIYKKHPDYLYLCDVIYLLTKRQADDTSIQNVIGYCKGLKMYIDRDDLVSMRRHEHPERYVESFTECRKKVEKLLSEKPKAVFIDDGKQVKGQMSIDNWLTV